MTSPWRILVSFCSISDCPAPICGYCGFSLLFCYRAKTRSIKSPEYYELSTIIDSRNREVNGFYLNCAQGSPTDFMLWGRIIWTEPAYCCLAFVMARRPCRPEGGYGCSSTPKSGLGVEFSCCYAAKFLAKNGFDCWFWWPSPPAETATWCCYIIMCVSGMMCRRNMCSSMHVLRIM